MHHKAQSKPWEAGMYRCTCRSSKWTLSNTGDTTTVLSALILASRGSALQGHQNETVHNKRRWWNYSNHVPIALVWDYNRNSGLWRNINLQQFFCHYSLKYTLNLKDVCTIPLWLQCARPKWPQHQRWHAPNLRSGTGPSPFAVGAALS